MKISPYSKQSLNKADIKNVVRILKSDFITQGPEILNFEKNFAKYVNSKYAVACNSGTAALHIACQALGINKKSNVITSTITFVASANCASFMGAKIFFSDIDSKSHCISVQDLESQLKTKKIDLVVVVHMAGHPADMKKIKKLKEKYNFKIIEDSCHALGGKYLNKKIGSCFYSDISTFSFHPVKIITTAEGGIIVLKDDTLADRLAKLRAFGVNRNHAERKVAGGYDVDELGFNYRMSEVHAAIGVEQLKKLPWFLDRRRQNYLQLSKLLLQVPF